MKSGILVALLVAACGTNATNWNEPQQLSFGPYSLTPTEEVTDQCVQITLHNDTAIYINKVELVTGPGFHHSNWFWVAADDPAHGVIGAFSGPDGTFTCADRAFDQGIAAFKGGVLFAQSTQAQRDTQQFPAGAAIQIPANSKIISTIHLLNSSDQSLKLNPTITLTTIPEDEVTIHLAGVSFENHALGLPPNAQSSFTTECDLMPQWQNLQIKDSATPDFKIYFALAHYHAMGTGLQIEAVKPDGTASSIFETSAMIGDALGAMLTPAFDMTGYTHLRYTCDFYNDTTSTVAWGTGNQEMCVFLAFSDSPYNWGGGEVNDEPPPTPATVVNNVSQFDAPCEVFANESSTH